MTIDAPTAHRSRCTARRAASGRRRSRRTSRSPPRSRVPTGSSSSTSTCSSAASRPISTSNRSRRIADVVRDEAALREPELLPDLRRPARQRPARPRGADRARGRPSSSRPTHIAHILGRCSRATTPSSSTPARCSTSGRAARLRDGRDHPPAGLSGDLRAEGDARRCSTTSTRPARSVGKSTFVLNNMFAREILKPRDIERRWARGSRSTCRTTRSCTSRPSTRACRSSSAPPRSPAAERLVKLAGSVFGQDGFTLPPAEPERRRLFGGLRRRS